MFWLHMNRGQYFSTVCKGFLTLCNISILAIAFAMVSLFIFIAVSLLTISDSVEWVYMYLEGLLTKVLVAAVGRVGTTLESDGFDI